MPLTTLTKVKGSQIDASTLALNRLADIDLSTPPTTGQTLVWNGSKFVAGTNISTSEFNSALSSVQTDINGINNKLSGGYANQFLKTDGNGNLSWSAVSSYSDANVASYLPTYTGNLSGSNLSVSSNATFGSVSSGIRDFIKDVDYTSPLPSGGALRLYNVVPEMSALFVIGKTLTLYVSPTEPDERTIINVHQNGPNEWDIQFNNGIPIVYHTFDKISATTLTYNNGNVTTNSLLVNGVSDLGSVSNVKITDGTAGQVLTTNGSGILSWADSGGVGGTAYLFVPGKGEYTSSDELQTAYNKAKTMTPYNSPLSSTNRVVILVGPGDYVGLYLNVDTPYIDIMSLTGKMDVILTNINVTANDVRLRGLDLETNPFTIADNLNLLSCENCRGGDNSFRDRGIASGTFINCHGGGFSFGGGDGAGVGTASGTFIGCTAGYYSFGSVLSSGTFTDCIGGSYSFGAYGTASGTFTNCKTANSASPDSDSFGGGGAGTASGTFVDCVSAGPGGFGGNGGTATGTFKNCTSGNNSFGGYTSSGTYINCTGGNNSFGGVSEALGTYTNCVGGSYSFGIFNGSGTFTSCVGGASSFGFYYASGTFRNCVGGAGSFGTDGSLTGELHYCKSSGTFPTPTGAGKIYASVDSTGLVGGGSAAVNIDGGTPSSVFVSGSIDGGTV